MLNFGVNPPYLPPRDDHPRPRRHPLLHPQPAASVVNEQRARARLHACNEAPAGPACADAVAGTPDVRLDTHWTRALNYNLFARGDVRPCVGVRKVAKPARVARLRRRGLTSVEAAAVRMKVAMRVLVARLRSTFFVRRLACRGL